MQQLDMFDTTADSYLYTKIQYVENSMKKRCNNLFQRVDEIDDLIMELHSRINLLAKLQREVCPQCNKEADRLYDSEFDLQQERVCEDCYGQKEVAKEDVRS